MQNTVLFLVADETLAAGERDYMKALAQREGCRAFVSNTSYATLDAARGMVDHARVLLGYLSFGAVENDANGQRRAHLEGYRKNGVARLAADGQGGLVVDRHPQQVRTPAATGNAAVRILAGLRLGRRSAGL